MRDQLHLCLEGCALKPSAILFTWVFERSDNDVDINPNSAKIVPRKFDCRSDEVAVITPTHTGTFGSYHDIVASGQQMKLIQKEIWVNERNTTDLDDLLS